MIKTKTLVKPHGSTTLISLSRGMGVTGVTCLSSLCFVTSSTVWRREVKEALPKGSTAALRAASEMG